MATVIVQEICAEWTKASRGGENAEKRNAIPEAVKIPVQRVATSNLTLAYHLVSYREYRGFSLPYEEIRVNSTVRPLAVGCVAIDYNEQEILAHFRYNRRCGGAPDRSWARKTFHITTNEWGQIVYNGRFVPDYDGDWWYEKKVVNVGLFERLTSGVFTRSEPTYRFLAMGELY